MGYQNVCSWRRNDVRIDVAVLSRLPVGSGHVLPAPEVPGFAGSPDPSHQRDLLRARIEPTSGQAFEDVRRSLQEQRGGRRRASRFAWGEARETRKIFDAVLQEQPSTAFVVCGDFNDYIDSEPLKAILGSGPLAMESTSSAILLATRRSPTTRSRTCR